MDQNTQEDLIKKIHFLKNKAQYSDAINIANQITKKLDEKNKNKIYFLLAHLYQLQKLYKESRNIIDQHLKQENSFKYIKLIRDSIRNPSQMNWFEKKMEHLVHSYDISEDHYFNKSILFHRFFLKDRAVEFAQKRLDLIIDKNKKTLAKEENKYCPNLAQATLLDTKKTLDFFQIPFFLISGTLLGMVREGKLLEHDYDIDIGIDESIEYEKIAFAFASTGLFEPVENNFQNYFFSFTHINGIKVDIFIHYKINQKYRHRTSYVAWDNTYFNLKFHKFLNEDFLIPENPEKYLEENYGNWQFPAPNYNTLLDTPNIIQLSSDDYILQLLMLMADSFQTNNKINFIRAAQTYQKTTGNSDYLNIM